MSQQSFTPADDVATIVAMFNIHLNNRRVPFTLIVRMKMKAGTQKKVDAAFAYARTLTMRDRGVISFDLNREAADPDSIVVYERWRSLDDMEAHLRTPHATALREAFNDMIDGVPAFSVLRPADEHVALS